jgi:hypothetical protein
MKDFFLTLLCGLIVFAAIFGIVITAQGNIYSKGLESFTLYEFDEAAEQFDRLPLGFRNTELHLSFSYFWLCKEQINNGDWTDAKKIISKGIKELPSDFMQEIYNMVATEDLEQWLALEQEIDEIWLEYKNLS